MALRPKFDLGLGLGFANRDLDLDLGLAVPGLGLPSRGYSCVLFITLPVPFKSS